MVSIKRLVQDDTASKECGIMRLEKSCSVGSWRRVENGKEWFKGKVVSQIDVVEYLPVAGVVSK